MYRWWIILCFWEIISCSSCMFYYAWRNAPSGWSMLHVSWWNDMQWLCMQSSRYAPTLGDAKYDWAFGLVFFMVRIWLPNIMVFRYYDDDQSRYVSFRASKLDWSQQANCCLSRGTSWSGWVQELLWLLWHPRLLNTFLGNHGYPSSTFKRKVTSCSL